MTNAPVPAPGWQRLQMKLQTRGEQSAPCCARNSLSTNSWIPAVEKRVEEMRSPPSLCQFFCGASQHREGLECLITAMAQAPIYLVLHFKTAKPHDLRLICSWDAAKWNTLSCILHPLDHPAFFPELISNQLLLFMDGGEGGEPKQNKTTQTKQKPKR